MSIVEQFENYVNSFPGWYSVWTPFVMMLCAYTIAFGFSDSARFGSGFYGRRMIRGLVGFTFTIAMAWPVVIVAWLVFSAPAWARNQSELDQLVAYDARRSRANVAV